VHKRGSDKQRGQALVEFAVLLPVLLLVLFAILQFGVVFNNYIQVTSAAREGCRKAAVSRGLGTSGAESAAVTAADGTASGLTQSQLSITFPGNPTFAQGSTVTVQASYPYSISLLGLVVSSGNLTSSTTMRVE
jgi:Flp pilus assembly protein TadG